jgi:hypothetical protein
MQVHGRNLQYCDCVEARISYPAHLQCSESNSAATGTLASQQHHKQQSTSLPAKILRTARGTTSKQWEDVEREEEEEEEEDQEHTLLDPNTDHNLTLLTQVLFESNWN